MASRVTYLLSTVFNCCEYERDLHVAVDRMRGIVRACMWCVFGSHRALQNPHLLTRKLCLGQSQVQGCMNLLHGCGTKDKGRPKNISRGGLRTLFDVGMCGWVEKEGVCARGRGARGNGGGIGGYGGGGNGGTGRPMAMGEGRWRKRWHKRLNLSIEIVVYLSYSLLDLLPM
eukprot:Gb_01619 [translate_table: standard]